MSTNALAILGDGYQITITPEAERQKATILTAARAVVAVTDPDSCDIAQSRLRSLASVRTAVESSRKIVKAPVIDLGKRIDGIAADFVAEVIAEEARLSGLVTEYAREQQRIKREAELAAEQDRQRVDRERHEAEMAAQREAARIERERQAAERAAHEAEIARLKAEAAQSEEGQKAAREAQEKALAAQREAEARAEAARLQAEADAAAARDCYAAARIAAADAVIAAPAPAGVREEIDFDVEDILAFVAKFPQLCRIEPKRADVLAALKKSFERNGKLPEVAGLRVFQNLKVKR
jgi:DNA repair exonuclease SbcCD ATPase subunit